MADALFERYRPFPFCTNPLAPRWPVDMHLRTAQYIGGFAGAQQAIAGVVS